MHQLPRRPRRQTGGVGAAAPWCQLVKSANHLGEGRSQRRSHLHLQAGQEAGPDNFSRRATKSAVNRGQRSLGPKLLQVQLSTL